MEALNFQSMYIRLIIFFLFGSSLFSVGYSQKIQEETDTINIKASSEGYNLDVLILKKSAQKTSYPPFCILLDQASNLR